MIKRTFMSILFLFLIASHAYIWLCGVNWGMNLQQKIEKALYGEKTPQQKIEKALKYNSKEPMRPGPPRSIRDPLSGYSENPNRF